jgi:hypothetical protein
METNNVLEILEDLIDDDPFIRRYSHFEAYLAEWDEMGGDGAIKVPVQLIFDFYAEKVMVEDALHTWYTYDPVTQLTTCKNNK